MLIKGFDDSHTCEIMGGNKTESFSERTEAYVTKLEFLRRGKKLSQKKLAKELGFTNSWYLNLLERHRPAPETVSESLRSAVEGYFGMTLETLLSEAEMR